MGILSTIFGSGDVISKGLDLIDDMHTSDVEMVEAKTKAKTDLMAAYAPFKIAQRYIAVMFGGTYISTYLLVIAMTFMGQDITEIAYYGLSLRKPKRNVVVNSKYFSILVI